MAESDEEKTTRRDGWMIAAGVSIGLLVWFAVGNASSVSVHFWVTTVRAPLIIVIVASSLLGAMIVELWRRARPRKK